MGAVYQISEEHYALLATDLSALIGKLDREKEALEKQTEALGDIRQSLDTAAIKERVKHLDKMTTAVNFKAVGAAALGGLFLGLLLSLFPMSSKLYDYYEKEFTEALNKTSFRIENLKKKNAQTLAALEAEHAKEIEKLKNDYFQKNSELKFQAVEAKRQLKQFRSNSDLAIKLQEADVKINYSVNQGDGFVTLSIDRDSVRHIPISRDNKLVFKPREKF